MANEEKTPSKKNEGSEPVGPRGPLLRSKNDRLIWGVAGGLAAHIGFSATVVRLAFVVLTLFGGAVRDRRQATGHAPAAHSGPGARYPGRRDRRSRHQVRQLGRGEDLHADRRGRHPSRWL